MINIKTLLPLAMITIAFLGAFLVANTISIMRKKACKKIIAAKAFLNDSFLNDSWKLIYVICFLFLVIALIRFNEMFGFFFEEGDFNFLQDTVLLAIMTCSVISQYKWFRLLRPSVSDGFTSEKND